MREEYRPPALWDRVALICVVLLAVVALVGWIEYRFDSIYALIVLFMVIGFVIAWAFYRMGVGAAVAGGQIAGQAITDTAAAFRTMGGVARIGAQRDLEFERDVRRISETRARLLTDAQSNEQPVSFAVPEGAARTDEW